MSEEGWVTFRDLDTARAAFALGPVKYRCLACGRVHTSGTYSGQKCLGYLRDACGWRMTEPPVPPVPKRLELPYRFTAAVLEGPVRAWGASRVRDLPEYLLALDARADLREALERCLAERSAQARAAAGRAWEAYSLLWPWLDALAEYHPPCTVVAVQRAKMPNEHGTHWVAHRFWVRPSVPCPVPEAGELLAVRPQDYSLNNLVWFGYGRRGLGAVSVWCTWDPPGRVPTTEKYEVLRQFYGSPPEVTEVNVRDRHPDELPRVLAGVTDDLVRAISAPPVWGIADPVRGWAVTGPLPSGYLGAAGETLSSPVPGRLKVFATEAEAVAAAGGVRWRVEELVVARA
ncbi:MAG: hypothetical protein AB1609_16700 [Bacillota bacterium]